MPKFKYIILLICIYSLICQETYPLDENDENKKNEEMLWGNGKPINFDDDDENIPWGKNGPIDLDDEEYIPWGNDGPIDFDDYEYIPWGKNGPIDFE